MAPTALEGPPLGEFLLPALLLLQVAEERALSEEARAVTTNAGSCCPVMTFGMLNAGQKAVKRSDNWKGEEEPKR
jgi:hypothetical protein